MSVRAARVVFGAVLVLGTGAAGIGGRELPAANAATHVCGANGTVEDVGSGWLAARPRYPTGAQTTTRVAAPAFESDVLYATNGRALMRSADAGCSWSTVRIANASTLLGGGTGGEITALSVPSSANSSSAVYLGITATSGALTQPTFEVSLDDGRTWNSATGAAANLPPVGTVVDIAGSPQLPGTAFAVVDVAGSTVNRRQIYFTGDGGQTWNLRSDPRSAYGGRDLTVDRSRGSALVALDGKVVASNDNAATFAATGGQPKSPIVILTSAPGNGGLRLAGAPVSGASEIEVSADTGSTWQSLALPIAPNAVAPAPDQDLYLAAGSNQVAYISSTGGYGLLKGPSTGLLTDLQVSAPNPDVALVGLSGGAVVRAAYSNLVAPPPYGPPPPPPVPIPPRLTPVLLQPPGKVRQFPSSFAPAHSTVTLPVGAHMELPYTLRVPRTPTPVDLMFLVDSTGSYTPFMDSLRQGIGQVVSTLNASGLDANFGVGGFVDYEQPAGYGSGPPWLLLRRIGPADSGLASALNALRVLGGTGDGRQDALTAIYQSTTGEGERYGNSQEIEPHLDARYREHSLKLALTSTDTEPREGGQRYTGGATDPTQGPPNPGPTSEQVIAALKRAGVRSIGIPVEPINGASTSQTSAVTGGDSVPTLKNLATGSDAVAPPGGTDCNADGAADIPAGGPLVCVIGHEAAAPVGGVPAATVQVDTKGLAAAIISVAAGVPDVQRVSVSMSAAPGRAQLVGQTSQLFNLHADNELTGSVELSCPSAGESAVRLRAATAARQLAVADIDLRCDAKALPLPVVALPGIAVGSAPAPAPQAPASQVNPQVNPNPNPNPNTNPNTAPNVAGNSGLAEQAEDQAQLAFAHGEMGESGVQLEMSAALFVGTAGLIFCGAGGVALRLRRREEPKLARA